MVWKKEKKNIEATVLGAKNLDEQKKYDKVHIDEAKRHLFILLEHGKKMTKGFRHVTNIRYCPTGSCTYLFQVDIFAWVTRINLWNQ